MRQLPTGFSIMCLCVVIVTLFAFTVSGPDPSRDLQSTAEDEGGQKAHAPPLDSVLDTGALGSLPSVFLDSETTTMPAVTEEIIVRYDFGDSGPNLPPFLSDVLVHDNSTDELHPRITVDDTNDIFWTAFTHNNGMDDDLYVAVSNDAGATWWMSIGLENPWNESKPAIAASDGTIMVFYEHDDPAAEQLMRFLLSTDNGLTWSTSAADWSWTSDPGGETQEDFDNLDVSSTRSNWWHVASDSYHPDTNIRRISFMWSDDNGVSWTMVYFMAAWRPNQDHFRPVIMENTVDNYMHLAFEVWNITEAGYDIHWLVVDHVPALHEEWTSGFWDGGNTNMYPDIWVRGDEAYLVWQNGTANPDLAGFYSDDGGDTSPTRLYITSQNGFAERYPAVYVDGSNTPHISCVNETSIMYMNNTDVLTQPWQTAKADDAPGTVVDTYRATDLTYYSGSPGIVWNDNRRGNDDIFFTALGTNIVQYTITKDPLIGIGDLIVDSVPCTAPCVFDWQVGDDHTIEAAAMMADPVTPDQKGYVFSSWSDGGARVHDVTVGPTPTTITASYDTVYNATIETDPSGLNVTIDGLPYVAPQTFWWLSGSVHLLEADSPQAKDPWSRHTWVSWSDGGGRSHPITFSSPAVYTAYFDTECLVCVSTSPMGLEVVVDAVQYISPTSFWWFNGSVHEVEALSPIPVAPDEMYVFSYWSDG
ncbi:MAG: sialidase family protein, partial [Thermoplasmata archaeon]